MQFDHNAKPVPRTTNSRFREFTRDYWGFITFLCCVLALVWAGLYFYYEPWRESELKRDSQLDALIEAHLTADSSPAIVTSAAPPTATKVMCQVGLPQGTVCYWQPTPTPPSVCPIEMSGYCVYDGPRSLVPKPTGTPEPYAGGSINNPNRPTYGGFSGTPVPIGDTAN